MGALRALLRVELRSHRRHPWRTMLLVLWLALPCAGLVAGWAMLRTVQDNRREYVAARYGTADLLLFQVREPVFEEVLSTWPADASYGRFDVGEELLDTGAGPRTATTLAFDPGALDPGGLAHGIAVVRRGRAPAGPGEVALSPSLLVAKGAQLGDEVEWNGHRVRVTGVAVLPEDIRADLLVRELVRDAPLGERRVLVEDNPAWDRRWGQDLHRRGIEWKDRRQGQGPHRQDRMESAVVLLVASFAFTVAALVVGAAVSVGLRRRQREIGLVTSLGAERFQVVRAVLVSIVCVALLAAALGIALGAVGAALVHPYLHLVVGRLVGDLEFRPLSFAAAPALAVVFSTLAAWPAILRASGLPPKVALGLARPVREVSGGVPWWPLGVAAAGAVAVFTARPLADGGSPGPILLGSVLGILGWASAASGLLRLLGKRAGRWPLPLRLVARDAARAPLRNGAAAAAVLAGLSLAMLLSSLGGAVQRAAGEAAAGRDPTLSLFLVGALGMGLAVVAAATALNAVEAGPDRRVLVLTGASPHTLRLVEGARAAYLALVGGVLSVPAGLLPTLGVLRLADVPLSFVMPWPELLFALVILPTVAFGLGMFVSFLLEPRRARSVTPPPSLNT